MSDESLDDDMSDDMGNESLDGDMGDDMSDDSLEGDMGDDTGDESLEGDMGDDMGGESLEGDMGGDMAEEESLDEKLKKAKERYDLFTRLKTTLVLLVKFKSKVSNLDSHENEDELNNTVIYINRKLSILGEYLQKLYEDFETLEPDVISKILDDCKKEMVLMLQDLEKSISEKQKTKKSAK